MDKYLSEMKRKVIEGIKESPNRKGRKSSWEGGKAKTKKIESGGEERKGKEGRK